uniref:Uncharacterized protein n=1 Tax=Salmo trutta TaxID=8032 RepID=A0A673XPC2_SALTR
VRHTLAGHGSAPSSCPSGQSGRPSHNLALATQLPEASSLPSPQSSVPSQRKRRDTHRLLPQLLPQVSSNSSEPSRQSVVPSQRALWATQPPSLHRNPGQVCSPETQTK